MLTDLPTSNHSSEDIHEHGDIDEVSFQTDVGNITDPDLIPAADVKILNPIAPLMPTVKRLSRSTGTFDSDRKIICFHQSGDASITDGVSHTHQQLCDTSIPIFRITPQLIVVFRLAGLHQTCRFSVDNKDCFG